MRRPNKCNVLTSPELVEFWVAENERRTKFTRVVILEGRHLHSTAWCWHPDDPVMLEADWKTPTPKGRFVMEYLAAPGKMSR